MRMGQEHILNFGWLNGQFGIFKHIHALLHPIIDEEIDRPDSDIMTASGHLMICTDKLDLHIRLRSRKAPMPSVSKRY